MRYRITFEQARGWIVSARKPGKVFGTPCQWITLAEGAASEDGARAWLEGYRRDERNRIRRERHQVLTDLGLKRVRGSMGGVYYE